MAENSLKASGMLGLAGYARNMDRMLGLADRLAVEARAITDGTLGRGLAAHAQEMDDALRLVDRFAAETTKITDGTLGRGLAAHAREMDEALRLVDRFTAKTTKITDGTLGSGFAARAREMDEALRLVDRFATETMTITELVGATASQATLARESAMPIQCIGRALNVAQPFDGSVTTLLREHLGDWRGLCGWPNAIIDNHLTRTEFYRALGFTDRLTSMPEPAFYRCLDRYGVHLPALPNVGGADRAQSSEVRSERDESVVRNCEAYELLLRFEVALRRFIDNAMRSAFGKDWAKHRVPADIYKNWKQKRQYALDAGESMQPLINYADFSDYAKIIARGDNWRELFRPIFKRHDDVQEAFCRLHPIRLCTMHARAITTDDHLLLRVETRRILKAIGIVS